MGKSESVDAKAWAILQAIHLRVARDPGWRVLVRGRDWLCPYCGEVGVSPYVESRGPQDIFRHLAHECRDWGEDRGTRFSHAALDAKARRLEVEELLRTDPAWRQADRLGRWFCPHCAEATTVLWHVALDAPPPLDAVLGHLDACPPCRDKRKPQLAEALALIVDDANRHGELAATARRKIETDPAWRQATSGGTWVCPQCHQPVPEVDVSSDLLLVSLAPGRIARHLMEGCGKAPSQPAAAPVGQPPSAVGPLGPGPAQPGAAVPHRPAEPKEEPSQRNLERAREIVQKMLPAEVPRVEGYDLYCLYRPTDSVGGDFYDYFRLSDHEVAMVVGDVSGHGLEAALIMTMVKKSLKLHAQHHRSPAEVLRRTNLDINADLDARTFVSACYAVLDARGASLAFARAGHSMPILFNPRRSPPVRHLESKGMALGMYQGGLFDKIIQECEVSVRPGDVFLLYTDGLTEARNERSEAYGLERLEAAIARTHGDLASQTLAGDLFEDARRFAAGAPQEDDIAVLCLRCL